MMIKIMSIICIILAIIFAITEWVGIHKSHRIVVGLLWLFMGLIGLSNFLR